jgi:hypothetical protein
MQAQIANVTRLTGKGGLVGKIAPGLLLLH